MLIESRNIIHILKRTLNFVDYRIVDHGERVAYIVLEMLKAEGNHSERELIDICFLCMLHDIGAFKTEEIDALTDYTTLMNFEIRNVVDHVAYGYLFLKKFSILTTYVDAILYHHTRYDELVQSACKNKGLASKIFLADRVDILLARDSLVINDNLFGGYRDTIFSAHDIDLIIKLNKEGKLTIPLVNGDYQSTVMSLYDNVKLTNEQAIAFLTTIVYAIDVRSEFTVMHTITMISISVEIAKFMGIDEQNLEKIRFGALLHDIGKIATSVMLLEKSGKLNDFEFTLMKDHVVVSETILRGLVDDEIFGIAVKHHEKPDGSGYPHGLTSKDLNQNERIACVADVLSALLGKRSYKEAFSEEKIRSILADMASHNKLDATIVEVVLKNYTQINENAHCAYDDIMEQYHSLNEQFSQLRELLLTKK